MDEDFEAELYDEAYALAEDYDNDVLEDEDYLDLYDDFDYSLEYDEGGYED